MSEIPRFFYQEKINRQGEATRFDLKDLSIRASSIAEPVQSRNLTFSKLK